MMASFTQYSRFLQNYPSNLAFLYHNLCLACFSAGDAFNGQLYFQKAKQCYIKLHDESSIQELLLDLKPYLDGIQ